MHGQGTLYIRLVLSSRTVKNLDDITLFPINGAEASNELEEDSVYVDSKDEDKQEQETEEDPEDHHL